MLEFISSLARRQPPIEYMYNKPRPPTHPDFPDQYNRVHDAYGPGSYLAWVLTAIALFLQLYFSRDGSKRVLRNADKDIFIVLAYPTFAAGHLIHQVLRYPGVRTDLWVTEQEDVIQYAAAIWASTRICVTAMSLTFLMAVLIGVFYRSYWRLVVVLIINVFVLTAGIIAGKQGDWKDHLETGFLGVVLLTFLISAAVGFLINSAANFMLLMANLRVSMLLLAQHQHQLFVQGIGKIIGNLFYVTATFLMSFGVFIGYIVFVPTSQHSLLEPFQALALIGGLGNLGFTLRGLLKEYGWNWWRMLLKDNGFLDLLEIPSTRYRGV
ncbi:hypothetical protein BKA66DRAFT_606903 [Pyrenochaeta sp. MPI-SDFR-AT-0127]|nr:hypothetical protein BKA66DRAFT_606903 [Pyrenochaeta sp. MPI-SDFR-AT-0127]